MSFDDSTSTNLMRELAALAPKYSVSWCPLCGGGYGRGRLHTCNTAQAVVAVSNAARDADHGPLSVVAASSPLTPASSERGAGA